jgi:hypothetical protein
MGISVFSCTKKEDKGYKEATESSIADSIYVREGNRIVALTFDTLRDSLLKAIGTMGMEGSITFCNEQAHPLTSTYEDSVIIRRTSERYRNPYNRPDSLELAVLHEMDDQIKSGGSTGTKVVRENSNGEIHFFKPILLQPMCLNCHGTPGDQINNGTLTRIQNIYPNDRAVNFKEGDLRGEWHIIFPK